MTVTIKQLYARLDNCLIADRFAIRKKIQRLQQSIKQQKPNDRLQNEIDAALQRSEDRVARRDYSQPINYPDLPVSGRREEIAKAIAEHQVVVIAGETGSGKTTQIPKICLELGLGKVGLIGHTQPRRLAARTVANRIAEELQTSLGSTVGYQVRFTEQVADNTMVKLMTDGILLAETQNDRYLERYQVLIIDEAHERSLNIDFLLGYLHRILPKRPDLKVIITSATIDLDRFSQHFNNAPVIEVSGRTFPVELHYRPLEEMDDNSEKSIPEGIVCAAEELVQLERKKGITGAGDILVFLSGEREIREAAEYLRKAAQQGRLRHIEVMPLYARLSVAEQNKIFSSVRGAGRRIVLSTNVAETSLTVPGIRYVIDPGLARISRYSYRSKVQRLPVEPVSQASANQRKGRCGRVAEGICIRLYSEEDFNARPEFTDAEIRRTNLAAVILQMLNVRLGAIDEFPFIDPPDSRYINDGFKLLQELGAVDAKRQLTKLGRQLSRLPVDPKIGRMLLAAAKNNCLSEMIVIASALSVQDPRERPMDKQQAADQKHREYADEESDFVTLVNLWNLYEEQRQELSQNQLRKYCQKQFLSYMRMREWRDVHRQLHLICRNLDYKENTQPAGYDALHQSLLTGLLGNMGFKQEGKEYLGARNRRFNIFPGSMLYKKAPKWIMAAELVETSRLYARMVARIDPLWAEPLAGHLVKRSYLEPHWEKKKAQVVAQEQVTLYGLIIVPGRTVHYGRIDPEVSQQIFIRSALVEGQFTTQGQFFSHNRKLLTSIEGLEAKTRRRDLLVDEDTLTEFYTLRLQENNGGAVVNGAGFENWRKEVEQQNPKILFMQEEDLLQRSADHVTRASYPEQLMLNGVKLKLSYHFEPGAKDDGVTLQAPLVLLNQISAERLEWLVPGMLKEKCVALLKGLPKSLRKNFVPIPDYVDAFVEAAVFAEGSLNEALALHLKRMTGVRISKDDLDAVKLDDHYRVNIRLRGEKGNTVTEGRDLSALQQNFGAQARQALTQAPSESWGRKGIIGWDFGDLPAAITLKQAGGLELEVYPGLQDCGDSVELKVFDDQTMAAYQNRLGLARLFLLQLSEQVRYLKNRLPAFQQTAILLAKVQNRNQLHEQCLLSAVIATFLRDDADIRTQQQFDDRLSQYRSEYCQQAEKQAELLGTIAKQYHGLQKQLSGSVNLQAVTILNDIRQQLEGLVCKDFLLRVPVEQLQSYPRYLKGVEQRLEKYQRELPRQRMLSEQLQQLTRQYRGQAELDSKHNRYNETLDEYRWMLEEYRISLFAQQLGTRATVSEKRLKQLWQQIE
ncbi:ATP-dependent RNA helicase HrpA [Amphritea sp. 2_MG-2023]|uniref:ATP-dependent RNA helicase HrpA n=1 Tax=Amphritea TaxID=515417 RepID=UPI001C068B75|nr:ATP-dependent RNA helicase HrpA [Amphritea sp. 2_MG-2023]MBU2965847.1 ATP-dependent RNA helicase HrpA [Amphritea atlantica]MDO6420758.1 ATP-dependent RNA helicase HrpA [Amphritea sp. 2_MG-2023]